MENAAFRQTYHPDGNNNDNICMIGPLGVAGCTAARETPRPTWPASPPEWLAPFGDNLSYVPS
jgi:hypothetical protein